LLPRPARYTRKTPHHGIQFFTPPQRSRIRRALQVSVEAGSQVLPDLFILSLPCQVAHIERILAHVVKLFRRALAEGQPEQLRKFLPVAPQVSLGGAAVRVP
jgi:hypothetical protein